MDGEKRRDYPSILERLARIEENQIAAKEAVMVAKDTLDNKAREMDKRLEGMNEFRLQLKEQAANFITRIEYDRVLCDIQDLKETRAMLQGKASQMSVNITMVISIISMVISIVSIFFMRQ